MGARGVVDTFCGLLCFCWIFVFSDNVLRFKNAGDDRTIDSPYNRFSLVTREAVSRWIDRLWKVTMADVLGKFPQRRESHVSKFRHVLGRKSCRREDRPFHFHSDPLTAGGQVQQSIPRKRLGI